MATQEERWERKKFLHASQIHAGNTIVVPQEKKTGKAYTKAIQENPMHENNKKNCVVACKLAVTLHAHSLKTI